jgi:hypothetical protein
VWISFRLPEKAWDKAQYKEGAAMGLDIKEIPLETLYISNRNVRQDSGDITELIDSIRDMGVLEPILVRQKGGRVRGHRWQAPAGSGTKYWAPDHSRLCAGRY